MVPGIDELSYMELDRCCDELLSQVSADREEKASVLIVSNESLVAWTKTFTDPRLCTAIVDRLTFGGNIRNEFGGGHGRARTPDLRDEMGALALDGGLVFTATTVD